MRKENGKKDRRLFLSNKGKAAIVLRVPPEQKKVTILLQPERGKKRETVLSDGV